MYFYTMILIKDIQLTNEAFKITVNDFISIHSFFDYDMFYEWLK